VSITVDAIRAPLIYLPKGVEITSIFTKITPVALYVVVSTRGRLSGARL